MKINILMIKIYSILVIPILLFSASLNRIIADEAFNIFTDDFELASGWQLTGEFEIAAPQGLGGSNEHSNPDPETAFSGTKVLGVDLTSNGDYENDLIDREYTAISPVINCGVFTNITLNFARYLNVEYPTYDHAYIDIWDGSVWNEIWTNTSTITDADWEYNENAGINISEYADFNDDIKIRFSMGATDDIDSYSGWNIDSLTVSGYETITVPSSSSAIFPVDLSIDNNVFGKLEWESIGSAQGYKIYFGSDGDGVSSPTNIINGSEIFGNNYSFSNLQSDVTYYWQIVPFNIYGDAVDCPIWSFETIGSMWGNVDISPSYFDFTLGDEIALKDTGVINITNNWPDSILNYTAEVSVVYDERYEKKERVIWNEQFNYDITTLSGGEVSQLGTETDGEFIYTTQWNSNGILKFNLDGSYVEKFNIPGVSNLWDLAYDGEYFYGGNGTDLIWMMDFKLKTLINTITYSGNGTRSIAYDDNRDAFWVNNSTSDIVLIDRAGVSIDTLETTNLPDIVGIAYDPYSEGGPYLWINSGTSAGSFAKIEQINLTNDSLTAVVHEDFSTNFAGGMFLSRDIVPGTVTLGVLTQGASSAMLYGFEIFGTEWIILDNFTGSINSGDSTQMPFYLDFGGFKNSMKDLTQEVFDLNAIVRFKDENNVYSADNVAIHVNFTEVDIEDNEQLSIINYQLKQNYPNPFNPITKISYQLAVNSKQLAEIVVYNAMGQKVWSSQLTAHSSQHTGSISFDGSKFNSGVYYYSLVIDGRRMDTKSMVLIK